MSFAWKHADPAKHNDDYRVPYKREPDVAGGAPQYDDKGKLLMKSQEELLPETATVEYAVHHTGNYSNGSVHVLADAKEDGPAVPVYFSYLWYEGEVVDGKPQYKILVAKGRYEKGQYIAEKPDGSGDFSEADYERMEPCDGTADHIFREYTPEEYAAMVGGVKAVFSCGGVTFLTVQNLQPYFLDDGAVLDVVNPYGKAILDRVRSGECVYVGQSAGTVAMSYSLGPLTKDTTEVHARAATDPLLLTPYAAPLPSLALPRPPSPPPRPPSPSLAFSLPLTALSQVDLGDDDFSLGPHGELGVKWLFPGLGAAHLHLSHVTCTCNM